MCQRSLKFHAAAHSMAPAKILSKRHSVHCLSNAHLISAISQWRLVFGAKRAGMDRLSLLRGTIVSEKSPTNRRARGEKHENSHAHISITARVSFPPAKECRRNCLLTRRRCMQFAEPSIDHVLPARHCARNVVPHKWKRKKNETLTSICHVSEPPLRVAAKVSGRRPNARGGWGGCTCWVDFRVRVTLWHVHDPTFRSVFERVPSLRYLSITRENSGGAGEKFILHGLYTFNSLALMSLALVARNRGRRDARVSRQNSRALISRDPSIDSTGCRSRRRDK